MSDQQEQDSNPDSWRKGKFIVLAGQHLDISKNGTSPIAQGCGSKQVGRTKADLAVSLSLGGYNLPH
jgi:hypothetical protein